MSETFDGDPVHELATWSNLTPPHPECCFNCRFWRGEHLPPGQPVTDAVAFGTCRIARPSLGAKLGSMGWPQGVWPETNHDDWCGEWQPSQHGLPPLAAANPDDPAAFQSFMKAMPGRARVALRKAGITSRSELAKCSLMDILMLPGVGDRTGEIVQSEAKRLLGIEISSGEAFPTPRMRDKDPRWANWPKG